MLPQKSNCAWIFRIGKLTNAAATRDIKKNWWSTFSAPRHLSTMQWAPLSPEQNQVFLLKPKITQKRPNKS